MAPGEVHYDVFLDFDGKEALSIIVRPVIRYLPRSVLAVENVQDVTGTPFAYRMFLKNAGYSYVSGYWVVSV